METEVEDVYTAGDIAQLTDGISGKVLPSALWPDAVRMGKVAGANMAGASGSLHRLAQISDTAGPFETKDSTGNPSLRSF